MTSERLDTISRPNYGPTAWDWYSVTPSDSPPANQTEVGNTGSGCIGLYVGMDGFVRFISRGGQFVEVTGTVHNVVWLDPTMPVELELAGVRHPVQWLPSIPASARVWAPGGTYLWGQIVHVLGHDTTVPLGSIHALLV